MANRNNPRRLRRSFRITTPETLEDRRVLATLAGTVYEDVDNNGVLDASDPRIDNATIFLDSNNNGLLDQRGFGMDPDEFAEGQVLNRARQTLFPSGTGTDNESAFRVVASENPGRASTGELVFGLEGDASWVNGRRLRFDFTLPVDSVSLDVVGASGIVNANVRMEAYGENGQLLESTAENSIASGEGRRMEISRDQKDIAYTVAYVSSIAGEVAFDNLRADDAGSERTTLTSESGFYRFIDVPSGITTIALEEPEGYDQTSPLGSYENLEVQGGTISLNFGNRTSSINGFIVDDQGTIGVYEPSIDMGIAGVGVFIDSNRNGIPDSNLVDIFPNIFLPDQVLDFVSNSIELSVADGNNDATAENVVAADDAAASPGSQVFTHEGDPAWTSNQRLRADFDSPARSVQLRFIGGAENGTESGRMVAFSATGVELASTSTRELNQGESQTLSIQRNGFDIAYVVAYTANNTDGSGRLADLRADIVNEPVAITDEIGEYQFKPLISGDYTVRILPSDTLMQSFPGADSQRVVLGTGDSEIDIDFGFTFANEPPLARNDFVTTLEDNPISIGVLVNDTDDGQLNEGSISIALQPINGVAQTTANGLIEYTPNENFVGRDSLQYVVLDDQGAVSNTAVVTIDVAAINDAPIAMNDTVAIRGAGATQIAVLANDVDIEGDLDVASIAIVNQPSNGTVSVNDATGIVTYTANSASSDQFSYIVDDQSGTSSNVATVTITTLAVGTPPVAANDSTTTPEGTARRITVTTNDTDVDANLDITSVFVVTLPNNGSVDVNAAGQINYQPDLGFIGVDTFSYRVMDDTRLASNVAEVSVTTTERDFPYHNPINPLDVDGNGVVIPRDVLFLINEINNKTITDADGRITQDVSAGQVPAAYFDVDPNGFISPRDVLLVIQEVNRISAASGEPTPASQSDLAAAAVASVFADAFEALDSDEEEEA